MGRRLFSGVEARALAAVALLICATEGHAEKVGVAAAVNPDAFSSLAGSPQSQLSIGKSIFYNERINTTGSGLVQVLLVDGSTFTVGPGSDLVIDKFVYDPKKGVGQISASFSKGVMRFVGGKISKNEGGVSVDTPAGALAIRGGIVYADFKNSKTFSILFVFGEYAKLGNQPPVFEPGNGYFSLNGQTIIKPFTAADLKNIMTSLTNSNTAGAVGTQNASSKPNTLSTILATQSLNQLIADANTEMVLAGSKEVTTPTTPTTEPTTPTTEPITPTTEPTTPPMTPTTPTTPTDPQEPACQLDCGGTPLGHLQGYAGALYQQTLIDEGDPPVGVLANWNAKHVDFDFSELESPDLNIASHEGGYDFQTFSAFFKLRVGEPGQTEDKGGAIFKFGAPDFDGTDFTAVYNGEFAGLTTNVKILHDDETPATVVGTPFAALASSGLFGNIPDEGDVIDDELELPAFCTDCTFLKWGIFGAMASFEDQPGEADGPIQHVMVLGFFAAGDILPIGQLPLTGTASYAGDVIATVSTNLFDGWETYVATGDLEMNWNFGSRDGRLDITNFDTDHFGDDGLSFTGSMCAPGVTSCGTNTPGGNHFGGKLTGELPATVGYQVNEARDLSGFALGSFVRGPSNFDVNGVAINRSVPQGVIGNWAVGNDRYMASGIFAGGHVPTPTQ
jgi:hypothetical protein